MNERERSRGVIEEREYSGANVPQLTNELLNLFRNEGYEAQAIQEPPAVIVQARKSGLVSTHTGTSQALTIWIEPTDTRIRVAIGLQEWGQDGALGGAAATFLASAARYVPIVGSYARVLPFAAVAARNKYREFLHTKAADKVWSLIERHTAARVR